MSDQKNETKEEKKGFFSKIIDKLDKSLQKKAEKNTCCGGDKKDGSSCC